MPFGSIALLLFSVATPRINMKKWVAPLLTAAILATCALPATAATKKIAVAGDIEEIPTSSRRRRAEATQRSNATMRADKDGEPDQHLRSLPCVCSWRPGRSWGRGLIHLDRRRDDLASELLQRIMVMGRLQIVALLRG